MGSGSASYRTTPGILRPCLTSDTSQRVSVRTRGLVISSPLLSFLPLQLPPASLPPYPIFFHSVLTSLFQTLSGPSSAFVFWEALTSARATAQLSSLLASFRKRARKGTSSATELLKVFNNPAYTTTPITITSPAQCQSLGQNSGPAFITLQFWNQAYWKNFPKMLPPCKSSGLFLNPPFYSWSLLQSSNHSREGHHH